MDSMRLAKVIFVAVVLALSHYGSTNADPSGSRIVPAATESVGVFLGRWDLTLKAPDREYPSWLELSEEGGQLRAKMVGRWGNPARFRKCQYRMAISRLSLRRRKRNATADMVFEGTLTGNQLSGTVAGPDGAIWTWTGRRAPALKRTGTVQWGKPIPLFNGKSLAGWRISPGEFQQGLEG